jgi:TIR domain-containing protein
MMNTANKILEDSLTKLGCKLNELLAGYSAELQPIRTALAEIDTRMVDPAVFKRSLISLAGAVINVRKSSPGSSPLRQLPVPPYDLWLPFMIPGQSTSDSEDLAEIPLTFNKKVDELIRKIITSAVVPQPKSELSGPKGDPSLDANLIFVSYAREDQKFLDGLKKYMEVYQRNRPDVPIVWEDSQIKPGQEWEREIEKAIRGAKIAVLLVSTDFLASEFVSQREVPQLLSMYHTRNLQIICIAVGPFEQTETPLGKLQFANDPEKPLLDLDPARLEHELRTISRKIFDAVGIPRGNASLAAQAF